MREQRKPVSKRKQRIKLDDSETTSENEVIKFVYLIK